jgi:aldose 1-epimerase
MANRKHPIVWLHHASQRLGLVPSLGGSVAAWKVNRPQGEFDLWRPWDEAVPDLYSLASFPLVPWSNRISAGGFEHAGRFHPIQPNRSGEQYPIHGDGWLQEWRWQQLATDTVEMVLKSDCFQGNPYQYSAKQRFVLREDGMDQTLTVTHTGAAPLPYGLGQHPCFVRTPQSYLKADVQGVWLSGADTLPIEHTGDFPNSWDLRAGISTRGSLIDNAYTGWSGSGTIFWPERSLEITMSVPDVRIRGLNDGYCLLYRPETGPGFCYEPVTHPIDAFHAPNQPGLRVLAAHECLSLHVEWRFR